MSFAHEQRRAPRRQRARGGRRATDEPGSAPLVLVAAENSNSRETCEAILCKLRFAVAAVGSVADAIGALSTLRPDIVVAHVDDPAPLRSAIWHIGDGARVPLIVVSEAMLEPDVLVEEIRRALRSRLT